MNTIQTVAIPTKDRPSALLRCLTSLLVNCIESDRYPEFLIADDSVVPAMTQANKGVIQHLMERYPRFSFKYADLGTKRRFTSHLAKHSGVDRRIIDFALANPEELRVACGSNRNAISLATAGAPLLSVDDDVVCRPALCSEPSKAPRYIHKNPTTVTLWPDPLTMMSQHPVLKYDLLGENEQALGLATNIERSDGNDKCKSASRTMNQSGASRGPLAVWNAFYGDCGARSPAYYLWKDKRTYTQLTQSLHMYRKLVSSRLISRGVPTAIAGRSSYFQSVVVAYANNAALMPFVPTRGLDLLFGSMVTKLFPAASIAYLPVGLLHAPVEYRRACRAAIVRSNRHVSLAVLLAAILDEWTAPRYASGSDTLNAFGSHLVGIARMPVVNCVSLLLECIAARRTKYICSLERTLQAHTRAPGFWSADLIAHIAAVRATLLSDHSEAFILVNELSPDLSMSSRALQAVIGRFGELLQAWPTLWETARRLSFAGISIMEPIS